MFYFNLISKAMLPVLSEVSILILLDVLLQLPNSMTKDGSGRSFNPYFTGCSTSTDKKGNAYLHGEVFQSLFYWMFYFN